MAKYHTECKGKGGDKKYPCPDCHFCQFCSETRCALCRSQGKKGLKLSFAEQIAMYEKLNRSDLKDYLTRFPVGIRFSATELPNNNKKEPRP